jgi:ketosteroid isomerase-like protein
MSNPEVVLASLAAYRAGDARTASDLLADDFRFTSPQDDHIDKATYLERCFPTADRFRQQSVLYAVEVSADDVILVYEYELQSGQRFRNTELITVRDGALVETQVFFGGEVQRG